MLTVKDITEYYDLTKKDVIHRANLLGIKTSEISLEDAQKIVFTNLHRRVTPKEFIKMIGLFEMGISSDDIMEHYCSKKIFKELKYANPHYYRGYLKDWEKYGNVIIESKL